MDWAYSDYLFKVLLVGDPAVGKSSIISKFTDWVFTEEYTQTFNANYKITKLAIEDSIIKAHIWDSPGDDFYKTLAYYWGGCFIIDTLELTLLSLSMMSPTATHSLALTFGLTISNELHAKIWISSYEEINQSPNEVEMSRQKTG